MLPRGAYSIGAVNTKPLVALAALAAAAEPDLGRQAIERLKQGLRDAYDGDRMGTTVSTVVIAAWLFYRAERGVNPKVDSYYAALEYITSSLSVGYTDIYPKTPAGKAIASAIMTVGPAMSGGILDPSPPKDDPVVARLDRILEVLEQRAASSV
jgi:hypothetical protein